MSTSKSPHNPAQSNSKPEDAATPAMPPRLEPSIETPSKPVSKDYDVGFKKPPKEHQFKPGETGNRHGRPKGSKNKATLFDEMLSSKLTVNRNGKAQEVELREANVLKLGEKAVKGDYKSQIYLIENDPRAFDDTEDEAQAPRPLSDSERKALEEFLARKKGEITND